jgi:hypothetical protein
MTDSFAHCNLTAINMMAFVDEDGKVNYDEMKRSLELAVYMAYIISEQELDLYEWDLQNKNDKIIGTTPTGIQDFFNRTEMKDEEKRKLLNFIKKIGWDMNNDLSRIYNSNPAEAIFTFQPHGTGSILMNNVSAGVHWSHSEYYKRRIRINADDPLALSLTDSGFNWYPEVGQTEDNHTVKVFEFAVKAPKGKTKYDVTAIEQLETYKMMMDELVDHNVSITVSVREHEWEDVEQWLWKNWDSYVGVSFISLDDSFYDLLPYEAINESDYYDMLENTPEFDVDKISKYETGADFDTDYISDCEDCSCGFK